MIEQQIIQTGLGHSERITTSGGEPLLALKPTTGLTSLEEAVLKTVSYADVFDFPLTSLEIHHRLVGKDTSKAAVQTILDGSQLIPQHLEIAQGYYTLPGRTGLIDLRQQRAADSAALWPRAIYYGQLIARLPFVRMVAVTGALAVENARPGDDIDYLVVTEPNRLWTSRAFVILLVKRAARLGDFICPNYFLSERALALAERDLFTAHELVQMVPIAGVKIHRRMMALNNWARAFLPNAYGDYSSDEEIWSTRHTAKSLFESVFRTGPGDWIERWEMNRKQTKFGKQLAGLGSQTDTRSDSHAAAQAPAREVNFCEDRCKGHFGHHGQRTLETYTSWLRQIAGEG